MALLATVAVFAPASWAVDTRLAKLEVKFFRHDYPKEASHARLERLEKLVFGAAKTGPESERLVQLMAAVPTFDPTPPVTRNNSRARTAYHRHPMLRDDRSAEPEPVTEPEQGRDESRTTTARAVTPPASSKYPAVTAMEKTKFGKDFASEHIASRLDRLEKNVYGQTFNNHDLLDRVDRLRKKTGVDIAKQVPTEYIPSLDDAQRRSLARAPVPQRTASKTAARAQTDRFVPWQDPRLLTHRWSPTFSRWEPLDKSASFSMFPGRPHSPLAIELGPGVDEYSYEAGSRRRQLQRAARGNSRTRDDGRKIARAPGMPPRRAGRGSMSPLGQTYAQPRPPRNLSSRAQLQAPRHRSIPPRTAPQIASGYGQDFSHPFGGYGSPQPRVYRSAPPYAAPRHPTYGSQVPVALIPHVTALELRQFGVAYPWDSLPQRINRLESAMIPTEQSHNDRPLPDRLARLVQLLPYGRWGGPLMAEQYRN